MKSEDFAKTWRFPSWSVAAFLYGALAHAALGQQCITNPGNGHGYKLTQARYYGFDDEGPNPDQPDWMAAEAEAVSQGCHLVTINNQAENDWLVATFGSTQSYWIGLTDKGSENTWYWISGESAGFRNWDAGQPDNFGTPGNGEDSAHIWGGRGGRWNDLGNPTSAPAIGVPWHGIIECDTGSVACPTVSEWGLVILGLLTLTAATLVLRGRVVNSSA